MPRIVIVAAQFYPELTDLLLAGAEAALQEAEADYDIVFVPGAFEIPGAIAMIHAGGAYDGYVALGCVIRGETTHYDYVCQESARGLNELAVRAHAPIGYGILTTENYDQARLRAAPDQGNKGRAAVKACLAMLALRQRFVPA